MEQSLHGLLQLSAEGLWWVLRQRLEQPYPGRQNPNTNVVVTSAALDLFAFIPFPHCKGTDIHPPFLYPEVSWLLLGFCQGEALADIGG